MMSNVNYLLLLIFFINPTFADTEIFVDRDEAVVGLKQSDYVNMWWQWSRSMPRSESPLRDMTGVKCSVNQAGPVWFLSGGYGTSKIFRKCSIPSDKYVFFPIINMLHYPAIGSKITCDKAKQESSLNNNHLVSFKVEIDDQQFVNPAFFRQASEKCFDYALRMPYLDEPLRLYPSATDGFWIMLKPLSVGRHKIAFHAEYDNPKSGYGRMIQHIAYELDVYNPE